MSATQIAACRACGSTSLVAHCDPSDKDHRSPTCDLWRCTRCNSYGEKHVGGRFADMRPKKGRTA